MAAPHVAGRVSLLQSIAPNLTPAEIKAELIQESTKGVITMQCPAGNTQCPLSPNQLLYSAC
jgi:hypothetical protein